MQLEISGIAKLVVDLLFQLVGSQNAFLVGVHVLVDEEFGPVAAEGVEVVYSGVTSFFLSRYH